MHPDNAYTWPWHKVQLKRLQKKKTVLMSILYDYYCYLFFLLSELLYLNKYTMKVRNLIHLQHQSKTRQYE